MGEQDVTETELGPNKRAVDPDYGSGHTVAFADGFPFLVATEVCCTTNVTSDDGHL